MVSVPHVRAAPLVKALGWTALVSTAAVWYVAALPTGGAVSSRAASRPADGAAIVAAAAAAVGGAAGLALRLPRAAAATAVDEAAEVMGTAGGEGGAILPPTPPSGLLAPFSLSLWSAAPARGSAIARWAGVDEMTALTLGGGSAALSAAAGLVFVAGLAFATATTPTRRGARKGATGRPAATNACWVLPADEAVAAPHALAGGVAVTLAVAVDASVNMGSASLRGGGHGTAATVAATPGGAAAVDEREEEAVAPADDVESVYYCTSGSEAEACDGGERRRMARDRERIRRMLLPATGRAVAAAAALAVAAEADDEEALVDVAIVTAAAPDAPTGDVPSADAADAAMRAGVSFAGAASAPLQVWVEALPVVAAKEMTAVAPWSPPLWARRWAPSSAPSDAFAVVPVAAAHADDADIDRVPKSRPPHPPVGDGGGCRAAAAATTTAPRPLPTPGSPCSGVTVSTSSGSSSSLALSSSASRADRGCDGGCATAAVAAWMGLRKEPPAAVAEMTVIVLEVGGTAVPGPAPALDAESDADTVASIALDHLCALQRPAGWAGAAVAAVAATTTAQPQCGAAPPPTTTVDRTTSGQDGLQRSVPPSLTIACRRPFTRLPDSCRAAAVLRAFAGRVPWHASPPMVAAAAVAAAVDATDSLAAFAAVLLWSAITAVWRAINFGEGGGRLQGVGGRNIRG